MQPIATDRIAWSVSLSVNLTIISSAKMAEPIEMPFGMWTEGTIKLRWGPDPRARGILRRKGRPIVKYRDSLP